MSRRIHIFNQDAETPFWQPTWEADVRVPTGQSAALASATGVAVLALALVGWGALGLPLFAAPLAAGLVWVVIFASCMWRFIPEHRARLLPPLLEEEAPEPHPPIIVRAAPEVPRETYEDDLWEFLKAIWDRRQEYPRPWSLRQWEGKTLRSGKVVTREYHGRLLDPLLRGGYILDYSERKSGRWNPKVTDFWQVARHLGLV